MTYLSESYKQDLKDILNEYKYKLLDLKQEIKEIENSERDISKQLNNTKEWAFINYELLPNDIFIRIVNAFTIEFERDSITMLAMHFIGEGVKQFKKSIMDNE